MANAVLANHKSNPDRQVILPIAEDCVRNLHVLKDGRICSVGHLTDFDGVESALWVTTLDFIPDWSHCATAQSEASTTHVSDLIAGDLHSYYVVRVLEAFTANDDLASALFLSFDCQVRLEGLLSCAHNLAH